MNGREGNRIGHGHGHGHGRHGTGTLGVVPGPWIEGMTP